MFADRIEYWREKSQGSRIIDTRMGLVDRTLGLLADIDEWMTRTSIWETQHSVARGIISTIFTIALDTDTMKAVTSEDQAQSAFEWIVSTCQALIASFSDLTPSERQQLVVVPSWHEEASTLIGLSNNQLGSLLMEKEQSRLLQAAKSAVDQATDAAAKAQESAGVSGSSSLSTHFSRYASGERWAANTFRVLSILSVVGALLAAIALGPVDAGNWTQLTYRVATVAAAGTLAAYFARQAGQHRRVYNWAKSLEVQLKSFRAFIEPIPDSERVEIYRAFARRVLSAPPEKGTDSAEDSVGAAQMLDLATALAKRIN